MGARHNRKRTRSRPRTRQPNLPASTPVLTPAFSYPFEMPRTFEMPYTWPVSSLTAPLTDQPEHHMTMAQHSSRVNFDYNWEPLQVRDLSQRCVHDEALATEVQRQRIFGGELGDETSLCPSMLQVVIGLFGGVDYEDP